MNLDKLIQQCDFSSIEVFLLQEFNSELITKEIFIDFEINGSIPCAKYIPKEQKIIIKPNDLYSSVIHELLHVKTLYVGKFPDFEAIEKIRGNRLVFFKQFFIDLTNDLHHFIFYEEFKRLTSHSQNIFFITNEGDYSNLKNKIFKEYLSNQNNIREKSNSIKQSYNENFIYIKYNILLHNGTEADFNLIKNYCEIIPFDNLFKRVLENSNDYDKVLKAYELFIADLESILINALH